MIKLIDKLPEINDKDVSAVKIRCLYESYKGEALFWCREDEKGYIALLDGNAVIYNREPADSELREFISFIAPSSAFSDEKTIEYLFKENTETVNVLNSLCTDEKAADSDTLSSGQIYELLNTEGITLPPYEFFAVDYCRRLNHGKADCYAIGGKCAAVGFLCGNTILINGIASREKGYGTRALKGLMSKHNGRTAIAVCRDNIKGFYLKNGFCLSGKAAYWVK